MILSVIKPLCIGKRDNAYILASETCALDTIGAEFVRDVEPGELVTITPSGGIKSDEKAFVSRKKSAEDAFLNGFILREQTVILMMSAYTMQESQLEDILQKTVRWKQILSWEFLNPGMQQQMGYAMESGIPYGTAFVKNTYVGRTFIKPKQSNRESSVSIKLNALKEAVAGKRVIMIDDSIVRGNNE